MPQEIDELQRRMTQLQIEKQALSKEKNPASRDRLKVIEGEIAERQEKIAGLKAQWESEKGVIAQMNALKAKVEETREAAMRAEREGDLNRAAELRYGALPQLQRDLDAVSAKLAEMQKSGALLREEVTDEDIAEIVSKWTGVPVTRMMESEIQKLVRMEDNLRLRVVGQEEAVVAVSNAVRRSRDAGHPVVLEHPHSVADKLVAKGTEQLNVDRARAYVDEIVTVTDDALEAATYDYLERLSLLVEPSGAATLAALRSGAVRARGKTVLVVSGGNADLRVLARILAERGAKASVA